MIGKGAVEPLQENLIRANGSPVPQRDMNWRLSINISIWSVLCFQSLVYAASDFAVGFESVTRTFISQWLNPTDVLSILLIIGGDVVQKAVAQLSGGYIVPVTFSFGWVAYSFSALMAAFGDGKIMPAPDCPSIVVNLVSGYTRENRSWVLGRILRDFEEDPCSSALRVVVFRAKPGFVSKDWIWYSGIATMILQCTISFVPFLYHGNWVILMVTLVGTVLALCDGALPQWRSEKWAARKRSRKIIALTRGNGSQHVMIIIGDGQCCDLEDLAAARVHTLPFTRRLLTIFCILRLFLLIVVAGLKQDAWYLLAIGSMGMAQNVVAASARRTPAAHGLPLEEVDIIEGPKVMGVLKDLEVRYPGTGPSLVGIFFPGSLRDDEERWWKARLMKSEGGSEQGRERFIKTS